MKAFTLVISLIGLLATSLIQAAQLNGTLNWSQRLPMGLVVSGIVAKVPVSVGQNVNKGDLLLALDKRSFQAALNKASTQSRHAKALWEEAQRENERSIELFDRTVLSEHELTQSHIALKQARATHQAAKSDLTQAYLSMQHSMLKAPFAGVVVELNAGVGQSVVNAQHSETLLVLANNNTMHFIGNVDLATANAIEQAGQVNVSVAGKQITVDNIHIGLEPVQQSANGPLYQLTAEFKRSANTILRVGQAASLVW